MPSRRLLLAAPALLPGGAAHAAAWPLDKPVEVIIPFPPSGGVDTMARIVLNHAATRIPGFRYAVTSRAGAGGQIGFEATFNAAPDGYTIGAITNAMLAHEIERPVRYRAADFTYLALVVDDPGCFWVLQDSPLRSLADVAAAARAAPETLGVGTAGIGTDDHQLLLGFEAATETRLVHVPYTGTAAQLRDLLGGRLAISSFNLGEGIPLMRERRIRCLGQAGTARWAQAPQIATFREQGIDVVSGSARGLAGPPGMAADAVRQLRQALGAAMAEPAYLADAEKLGLPLRPLVGADYRAQAVEEEARLRALWRRRPWKET